MIQSKGSGLSNTDHSKLKIWTHKQLLQRLPIALSQVKAGNYSGSLLSEIRQNVYSLSQSIEITKKAYNNIIKSVQWNWVQLHISNEYYIYKHRKQ